MTIAVNVAEIRQFERKLRDLNRRGIAFAETETINRAAFGTQKGARQNIENNMITRNTWTTRSVMVRKASLTRQEAVVGSTQPYMEDQELGATEHARGKHGVAIPTAVASGEGRGANPRRKLVRKPNRVSSISLTQRNRSATRKQRNAIAIKEAVSSGRRYVMLELQRRKGIFRVYGGKRRPRIEMIQDLSRKSIRIPRNPWLMPAAAAQGGQLPRYYAEALSRQLARLR